MKRFQDFIQASDEQLICKQKEIYCLKEVQVTIACTPVLIDIDT